MLPSTPYTAALSTLFSLMLISAPLVFTTLSCDADRNSVPEQPRLFQVAHDPGLISMQSAAAIKPRMPMIAQSTAVSTGAQSAQRQADLEEYRERLALAWLLDRQELNSHAAVANYNNVPGVETDTGYNESPEDRGQRRWPRTHATLTF